MELTQQTLAGAAGIHTNLLRMPLTTEADTLCGGEWTAAQKASAAGYVVVAAHKPDRNPALGMIGQFSQTETSYDEARDVLADRRAKRFTTVTDALGMPAAETTATRKEHWLGQGLITAVGAGRAFTGIMVWVLVVAGVLGLLRLLSLVVFARVHVRRLTRFRPGSPWLREVDAPVTVLIPVYNEEAGIEGTIRSLLASSHRHLEIIVIDDGSGDRTPELAAAVPDSRVRVVRQRNAGEAAALNTGLAHASYDIVVMVDADTVFESDAVHRLVQPLAHPAVGAVSGNTKVGNRSGLLGRWQHLEYVCGFNLDRRMFQVLECVPTVPGAIGAFRRDALSGVGGLSEDTLAEDTDLTMALWRAGWRVVYEESAIAWTEVPTTLRQLCGSATAGVTARSRRCGSTAVPSWRSARPGASPAGA